MDPPVKTAANISDEMWISYGEHRDPAIRDEILNAYLYLVRYIVGKTFPIYRNYADMDDVIQNGIMALFDAIDKFDPGRGNKFETYASFRIRGSVIDYMRKQDWMPRNIRKRAKDIENAEQSLFVTLGREPSDEELAVSLGMSRDDVAKAMSDAYGYSVVSFEELMSAQLDDDDTQAPGRPDASLYEDELKEAIASAIDKLTQNEKTVVSLYYYEELKLKEIAQVMDLSEARVSQIHSKAILKLRKHLENDDV